MIILEKTTLFASKYVSPFAVSSVNLSRIVPDGLLLFFPSFYLMEKTLEFWRVSED